MSKFVVYEWLNDKGNYRVDPEVDFLQLKKDCEDYESDNLKVRQVTTFEVKPPRRHALIWNLEHKYAVVTAYIYACKSDICDEKSYKFIGWIDPETGQVVEDDHA